MFSIHVKERRERKEVSFSGGNYDTSYTSCVMNPSGGLYTEPKIDNQMITIRACNVGPRRRKHDS